jgi:hypothetical protein
VALADSFSFGACVQRSRLCDLVASHTQGVASR